jgi:hypothetical protein
MKIFGASKSARLGINARIVKARETVQIAIYGPSALAGIFYAARIAAARQMTERHIVRSAYLLIALGLGRRRQRALRFLHQR